MSGVTERVRAWGPEWGVVLGSGLGGAAAALAVAGEAGFGEVPGCGPAGVAGHAGRWVWGEWNGARVVVALGRVHLYEGRTAAEVASGVRWMASVGVQRLILTNAAGSLERVREPGTWMVVSDQINLTGASPLEGPAFVEMGEVYGAGLRRRLGEEATRLGLRWSEGVYVGLRGPQYETPAEVRMLRGLGGDAVGMSTVLEAIAARAAGMEVAGISRITNFGAGLGGPLSHAEVVEVGGAGAAELGDWLGAVLARGGG